MSEPQIARRCRSCGVSIRVRASFCPQCGTALPPRLDAASEVRDTEALTPGAATPGVTETTTLAETKPLNFEPTVTPRPAVSTTPSTPHKRPKQATLGKVQRGGPQPRAVIGEDGLNRVEKFRQMSGAMIDEAAYDPSLRFVLVAAVLFVFFLVLLLLSELIT